MACNRSKEIKERLALEGRGNMRLEVEMMNSFQLKPCPRSKSGRNFSTGPVTPPTSKSATVRSIHYRSVYTLLYSCYLIFASMLSSCHVLANHFFHVFFEL